MSFLMKLPEESVLTIVTQMMNDKSDDVNQQLNDMFKELVNHNCHIKSIIVLLGDNRVDPSANHNYAIRTASKNNQIELVKILLQDQRIDPGANDNDAIRMA